ncbi:hypothetical protein K0M31_018575, partial [Melipona bicolor]
FRAGGHDLSSSVGRRTNGYSHATAGKLIVEGVDEAVKSKNRWIAGTLAQADVLLWNCRHVDADERSKTHQETLSES